MLHYKSEPDEYGKRHVECQVCHAKWHTKWPLDRIHHRCTNEPPSGGMTAEEMVELFGSNDPTLIGNRIAVLTAALGIPPCAGCGRRRSWLNKAHAWLRGDISSVAPAAGGESTAAPGPGVAQSQGLPPAPEARHEGS